MKRAIAQALPINRSRESLSTAIAVFAARPGVRRSTMTVTVLLAAVVWTYWSTLTGLVKEWKTDENYSVGQLVPFAALYMLWHGRQRLAGADIKPWWPGLGVVLAAQAIRFYGLIDLYESLERYALVLTIVGLILLVAGWDVSRRIRWILLFLFLMVPLPGQIHNMISGPLQRLATISAVFGLELAGITVARDGNVLVLNERVPVAVAEACSGLRMLTAFIVVAATVAAVVKRSSWQKAVLVVSSVPIAILCNSIRLIITAALFLFAGSQLAERFFHDFAGWTMMPIAVLMLAGELWILSQLIVEEKA